MAASNPVGSPERLIQRSGRRYTIDRSVVLSGAIAQGAIMVDWPGAVHLQALVVLRIAVANWSGAVQQHKRHPE